MHSWLIFPSKEDKVGEKWIDSMKIITKLLN